MDIFDLLLGRDRRRDDIGTMVGGLSRWIMRCGCLLLILVLSGVALLVTGTVRVGEDSVTIAVVLITMIVAVASLIRASTGY